MASVTGPCSTAPSVSRSPEKENLMTSNEPDQTSEGRRERRGHLHIKTQVGRAATAACMFNTICQTVAYADRALDVVRPHLPWL